MFSEYFPSTARQTTNYLMVLQEPRLFERHPAFPTAVLSVSEALVVGRCAKLFRDLDDLTGFVLHVDHSVPVQLSLFVWTNGRYFALFLSL